MSARCEKCGRGFERAKGEEWKKLCLSCWKLSKAPDESGGLQDENELLRFKVYSLEKRVRGLLLERTIEPEMLKRLIQLTHPDRHNSSEASHKATEWLLSQKQLMEERT